MFRFNPYKPNSIVGPGGFAGRGDELKALDQALFQLKNGNPSHFLIHGERGIGKSSLMFCVESTAKGQIKPWFSDEPNFNFITLSIELGPESTYSSIVSSIGSGFAKELKKRQVVKSAAAGVWDFLSRWDVMGVKYTSVVASEPTLVEELSDMIADSIRKLGDSVDGLIVFVDEADQAPVDAHLGEFIKLFTERLTRLQCNNVGVGLSGISPTVIQRLKKSHESSPRILQHHLLEPLLMDERIEVIQKGIAEANDKNPQPTTITPSAENWIANVSEGYPHFVQQYAHSAFDTDSDNEINIVDVHVGAFKEGGALDQLGARYFEDMYLDKINSDEYRKVLQAMAGSDDEYIARKEIKRITELKDTTLTNALSALKKKHIILAHREKQGLYKLPTNSFAAWIRARLQREAERAARKQDRII